MSCKTRRLLLLAAILSASPGCRHSNPGGQRLAILRFENLTADPSLDWMGRAFPEVLERQLSGSPDLSVIPMGLLQEFGRALGPRPVRAPGISAQREQALLGGANRIAYGRFSTAAGRMRVDVSLEDVATRRITQTISAAAPLSDGILAPCDSIVRRLSGVVRPFGTRSQPALQAYAGALDAADPAEAEQHLARAVASDGNFGAAYVAWARMAMGRGDRAAATRIIETALARGQALLDLDRARLDFEAAVLRNDATARMRALSTLAILNPSDPGVYRTLADDALNARQFRQSVEFLKKALQVMPDDVALWNRLGYAQAYAFDLDGATQALRRYEQIRPNEANPLDSLGDVHFYVGRFADAEKYYLAAYQKDPSFIAGVPLLKAAQARLMTGDIAGAEPLFRRYIEHRRAARDGLLEFWESQWQFAIGRRAEAVSRLAAFCRNLEAGRQLQAAAQARAQLSIWELELGNRAAAQDDGQAAVSLAGRQVPAFALVARFISQPEAPAAEWARRAELQFAQPALASVKQFALAYAWLFQKQFSSAAPLLKQLYGQVGVNTEEGLPVLLAWAYLETGRLQEAAPLLASNPLPQPGGFSAVHSLYCPRLFFLRAEQLAKAGKRDDAARDYRLFLKLSGAQPTIWGEEERARAASRAAVASHNDPAKRARTLSALRNIPMPRILCEVSLR